MQQRFVIIIDIQSHSKNHRVIKHLFKNAHFRYFQNTSSAYKKLNLRNLNYLQAIVLIRQL